MSLLEKMGLDPKGIPAYLDWFRTDAWPKIMQTEKAGAADAASLGLLGASLTATSPTLALAGAGLLGASAPLAFGAAGGYLTAKSFFSDIEEAAYMQSALGIRSAPPPQKHDRDGLLVGYTCDGGRPIRIPDMALMRHFMTGGMTGVGKTVSATLFMAQQIARGGGVMWVDGKLDPENIASFYHLAKWMGRESDIRVINPGDPKNSNTYNFVLDGDADEVASRILSTVPSTEGNAGADYYKQSANHGLTCLVATLKGLGLAYNCMDLSILLSNDKALLRLDQMVDSSSNIPQDVVKLFKLFLESVKTRNANTGEVSVDLRKMRDVFGGIAGRLFVYGVDKMGAITGSYSPDVRLYEDIKDGRLIYCALPTMGKLIAAQNFGKVILGDLRSAVARIQSLPSAQRPNPPFMVWMDEVQSYGSAQALATQFQQNRSANIFLGVGFQDNASIEVLGDGFLETVVGNTFSKIFFKPGNRETADAWADLIGKHKVATPIMTQTAGMGSSMANLRVTPDSMRSGSRGVSLQYREAEEYRLAAEKLMRLDFGQAVVLYGASSVYDIRVPMLNFDPALRAQLGPVAIQKPRRSQRKVAGLELFSKYADFISTLGATPGVKAARKQDSSQAVVSRFKQVEEAAAAPAQETPI